MGQNVIKPCPNVADSPHCLFGSVLKHVDVAALDQGSVGSAWDSGLSCAREVQSIAKANLFNSISLCYTSLVVSYLVLYKTHAMKLIAVMRYVYSVPR